MGDHINYGYELDENKDEKKTVEDEKKTVEEDTSSDKKTTGVEDDTSVTKIEDGRTPLMNIICGILAVAAIAATIFTILYLALTNTKQQKEIVGKYCRVTRFRI